MQLHTAIEVSVVVNVFLSGLLVADILGVPAIVNSTFDVGCPFLDGMLVETVEACLINDVQDGIGSLGDGQRRVAGRHMAIGLHPQDGGKVDALHFVAHRMPRHRYLTIAGLCLVGRLASEHQLTVHLTTQTDGNKLVGMGGKIFASNGKTATHVAIADDG